MPSLYIVLEREIPNADICVNAEILAKKIDELTQIAKHSGVPPLMEFFSANSDELASMLGEDVGQQARVKNVSEEWFPADDGLRTINALLQNLVTSRIDNRERLDSELREFVTVLELAKSNSARWHLAVDH